MKKSICSFLLVAPVLLTNGSALADPVMECSGQSSSQVETGQCLQKTSEGAEQALKSSLGFAMAAAGELDKVTGRPEATPALEAAQAAWSDYRQKHCDFVGTTFGGGSGTGIAILGCRIELARARTSVLMKYTR